MNFQMFRESGTGTRQALMKQQCVLMDEAQGHEFGEAAGFGLNVAQQAHLANPVFGRFGVSVHHRGCAANAALMCGADDFDPVRGGKLIGG